MSRIVVLFVAAGLAATSVGCKSKNPDAEADAVKLQVEELQRRNSDLERQLSTTKAQRDEALRQFTDAQREPQTPAGGGDDNAIREAGLEAARTAEGFECIRIGDEILFAPGHAEIRKEGEATLKKVADLVKGKWSGHTIRIDGHTDNDPIHKSAKLFQDNWHLSAMRGLNVLRFLVKQGVPEEKIFVAGFAETRPVGPNDTRAHKSKNRRVEVVVVD